MRLLDFFKEFPDEQACKKELIKKHGCPRKFRYLKMKVISGGFHASIFDDKFEKSIQKASTLKTDKSTSYCNFKESYNHDAQKIPVQRLNAELPWVHIMISNAKRLLLNVHHRVDDDFLGNYLNEFLYKKIRRNFNNLFDRLLSVAVKYQWNYLG